jgi:hypothetical protein
VKEAFTNLEKAAKKIHLQISQGETKYMPVTKKISTDGPTYLEIGPYKFETVYSFTYLGSEVNYKNYIIVDIQKRILSASRCFHGLRKHRKSHLISRKTKTLMCKVLVRVVLTYASETWTLIKTDERVFLEQCRGMVCGGKDTTMNYMSCLMSLTLSNTVKPVFNGTWIKRKPVLNEQILWS